MYTLIVALFSVSANMSSVPPASTMLVLGNYANKADCEAAAKEITSTSGIIGPPNTFNAHFIGKCVSAPLPR